MTNPINTEWAQAAARYFVEKHPRYIVCDENSKILLTEILRLVDEGEDPSAVTTYDAAFANCWEQLMLKEEEQPKTPEELTMEEIAALSPAEQERLPGPVLKRFANWELQQRRQKPVLSDDAAFIKQLFESRGFADSPKNIGVVKRWMDEKGLAYSESNLGQALGVCEASLEPSQAEIESMDSKEYKKRIVDPQFREWQAKQPKSEDSRLPFGVRPTRFLHDQ